MNWKKLSNIAIYSAAILAILDTFLGKYIPIHSFIPNHSLIFLILFGGAVLLFVVSELMKFINKVRMKKGRSDV
jgi:hypothetical protein